MAYGDVWRETNRRWGREWAELDALFRREFEARAAEVPEWSAYLDENPDYLEHRLYAMSPGSGFSGMHPMEVDYVYASEATTLPPGEFQHRDEPSVLVRLRARVRRNIDFPGYVEALVETGGGELDEPFVALLRPILERAGARVRVEATALTLPRER